ncbi:hypothetical protein Dimus_005626, partial [Dionaea muscipula]
MKRSTSRKGVDVEPASKKNSAPGTTKEIDTPNTEEARPDLASTSGKSNLVPTKEKVKDKEVPNSTLTPKAENCQDQSSTETAPVVIYDLEAVREIEHKWGGTTYEEELTPGQGKE